VSGMAEAVALLTPLGGARPLSSRAVPWFAVVGALIGLAVGGVWWGANELWPPLVAAALTVVGDLGLTGMLHIDGLADSADGLLPHADRERRLAIMAEPATGAFGVTAVVVVVALQLAALTSMDVDVLLVVAVWATARLVAAIAVASIPTARRSGSAERGMGELVAGASTRSIVATAAPLLLVLALDASVAKVAACLAVQVGAMGVLWLARRRLGGITGDVLGAMIVVGQSAGLLVGAARW
jgi:adenosylcobinamide-GDP ribazoletransferase